MCEYNCIVLLGPTASGKTHLACRLAATFNGEIISVDSRQVYKHLDLGTGKDLHEYVYAGKKINYHLIDVCEPGTQFYLHDFIVALQIAFDTIQAKGKLPILCGGTGLYLDALHKDFSLTQIKEDVTLREQLQHLSKEELIQRLHAFSPEHIAHVDQHSIKRLIRGIEVAAYLSKQPLKKHKPELIYRPYYIGLHLNPTERKERISKRLEQRLAMGLIEEVESLVLQGISHERLEQLGLEYKFVSHYLQHKLSKEEMTTLLLTAIVQFSKRQMTWFRKMEKEDVHIHWLEANATYEPIIEELRNYFV